MRFIPTRREWKNALKNWKFLTFFVIGTAVCVGDIAYVICRAT